MERSKPAVTASSTIIQPQFEILSDGQRWRRRELGDGESQISNSLEVGRIVPIYEDRDARQAQLAVVPANSPWRYLESLSRQLRGRYSGGSSATDEPLPPLEALWKVHWPEARRKLRGLGRKPHSGPHSLIFEELFFRGVRH